MTTAVSFRAFQLLFEHLKRTTKIKYTEMSEAEFMLTVVARKPENDAIVHLLNFWDLNKSTFMRIEIIQRRPIPFVMLYKTGGLRNLHASIYLRIFNLCFS